MKIDYNKTTVECSQKLLDWRNSFRDSSNGVSEMLFKVARMGWGYHLSDWHGKEYSDFYENERLNVHDSLEIKMDLLVAIMDNYEFKLEEPKKYYWRKKKEYLDWYEHVEQAYIIRYKTSETDEYQYALSEAHLAFKMTEIEVLKIMNDDFDKFEKVEGE